MADEELLTRLIPALWRGAAPPRECNFRGAVLVADLAGFTALTAALEARGAEGNEAMGALLNRLFARLTGAITAADGDVIHFSGDALSALFSDRVEISGLARAMGAARTLRLALAQHAQTRALGRLVPLRVRLGIGAGAIRTRWMAGADGLPVLFGPAVAEAWKQCALDKTALAHPPAPDHSLRTAGRLTRAQVQAPARALLRALDPAERANGAFRPVAAAFLRWPTAADRLLARPGMLALLHRRLAARAAGAGVRLCRIERCDKGWLALLVAGAPVAREGDERRLLALARKLANENAGALPRPAAGAAAGIAWCGLVGGETRADYAQLGECLNLAARLAVKARAGELLTHGFSADAAAGDRILKLKGYVEPVAARAEPPRRRGTTGPIRASENSAPPFVGRAAELSRLDEFLDGGHRLLMVSGDAGAGKSRLLGHWLAARRLNAARGACSAGAQAIPYTPWRGVVRDRLRLRAPSGVRLDRDLRAALRPLGAAGRLIRADLFGFAGFAPGPARSRGRRELLARGIAQLCGGGAGLLVIEDGHWLDGASALLLREILALPGGPRMILSLRPGPASAALAVLPADAPRLLLTELDANALQARAIAEWPGAPAWLGGWLHRRSEGNALYAGELIAALRRGPWGAGIPAAARPESLEATALPRSLRGLVQDRLDRLPAPARGVVGCAAVIGRLVPLRLLAATLDRSPENLQPHLAAAVASGLMAVEREGDDPAWIFSHALQQEAIYAGLAFIARRRLHGRAAGHLLNRRGSERAGAIGRAVHHLKLAGDKIRLSGAAREAAAGAARRQAFAEAWDYFALALGAQPRGTGSAQTHLALRLARGRCALELGRLESARRDFTHAAAGALRELPR